MHTSNTKRTIKRVIEFLHDCYEADCREFAINNIFHKRRKCQRITVVLKRCHLLLYDGCFLFKCLRIMCPYLSAEPVFDGSDNSSPAGKVFGICRCNNTYIKREGNLISTDLNIPLLKEVKKSDLNLSVATSFIRFLFVAAIILIFNFIGRVDPTRIISFS